MRDAKFDFAMAKFAGLGGAVDVQGGLTWLLDAAQEGNTDAQRQLGQRFAQGSGVERSDFKAYVWLRRAADAGAPIGDSLVELESRLPLDDLKSGLALARDPWRRWFPTYDWDEALKAPATR